MRIQQYPMKPGSWSLKLKDDTPEELLVKLRLRDSATNYAGHGMIVVTPGRTNTYVGLPTMLEHASYVGVYLRQGSRVDLEGMGLEWWIAHPDGRFLTSSFASAPYNFGDWCETIRDGAGTWGHNIPAGFYGAVPGVLDVQMDDQARGAVANSVMAYFNAEWRINCNTLEFDAGSIADLYGVTPVAYFRPGAHSPQPGRVILAGTISYAASVEHFVAIAEVIGKDSGGYSVYGVVTRTGVPSWSSPWGTSGLGDNVDAYEVIDSPEYDSAPKATVAAQGIIDKTEIISEEITLNITDYDSSLKLTGKYVGVFDPANGIDNPSTSGIWIAGEYCPYQTSRVVGLDWSPPPHAGVYLVAADGTKASTSLRDIVDLSDWIEHGSDAGSARVTCGALEPSWATALRSQYAEILGSR